MKSSFLFIAAAALFGIVSWLSVTMGEQYTLPLTVPLSIEDVPPGLAIGTPVPKTIQLRYRGDGWRLALLYFGAPSELRIYFPGLPKALPPQHNDSSGLAIPPPPAEVRILAQQNIAELAPSRAGVVLIGVTPDSMLIALEQYRERRIPVRPDVVPSFREGYGQVGAVTVAPESVTIGGAASIVARIGEWQTARTVLADLRAPVEVDVPLRGPDRIPLSLSVQGVHVSLNIQPFAEKLLTGIPVEVSGVPPGREVIFIPPRVDLTARGGIKQLGSLNAGEFHVRVPFGALVEDTTGLVEPSVSGPAEIHVVSRKPDRLQYIIRKRL